MSELKKLTDPVSYELAKALKQEADAAMAYDAAAIEYYGINAKTNFLIKPHQATAKPVK